jgi:hypothetical protein
MYKVTISSIRPDTRIEFFRYDDDMYDYIDETYLQTNKLVGKKVSITKDRTIEVIELMFENKQTWIEYMKDPIIVYQEPIKVRYNGYNKIAVSINVEEVIITKDLYSVYLR